VCFCRITPKHLHCKQQRLLSFPCINDANGRLCIICNIMLLILLSRRAVVAGFVTKFRGKLLAKITKNLHSATFSTIFAVLYYHLEHFALTLLFERRTIRVVDETIE